jgi:hypothetical protein
MPQIRFRNPSLTRMANGLQCVLLTEAGTWESFASFAQAFAAQIEATIVKRIDGPDVRICVLHWRDAQIRLVYDDFPNGISLEPVDADAQTSLRCLFEILRAESSSDGL